MSRVLLLMRFKQGGGREVQDREEQSDAKRPLINGAA